MGLANIGVTAITWVNLATSFVNNNLNRDDLAHSREFCHRFMQSLHPRNSPELYQVVRKQYIYGCDCLRRLSLWRRSA